MVHSGGVYLYRRFRVRLLFGNEAMRRIHRKFYQLITLDEAFEKWREYNLLMQEEWARIGWMADPMTFEYFCCALIKRGFKIY